MKRILNDLLPWLVIVLLIAGLFYLPRFDQPGYVKGDILSEHIVGCETCSNPELPADACPVGVRLQAERSNKTH